jgi:hypothetical protein
MTVFDEFYNMLCATRDPIGAHFDEAHVFIDRQPTRNPNRPIAIARRAKAFSIASLRGRSIWPPPVAVAEFVGGEKIRMSFRQPVGKPWRFDAARRLLAQTIGNERAREAANVKLLKKTIASQDKIEALYDRPGTDGEKAAAAAALKRKQLTAKKIKTAVSSVRYNAHALATDFIAFHIEHDGKRYDEQTATAALSARKSKDWVGARKAPVATLVSTQTEPQSLAALMAAMETSLGSEFLDTKAWRRVRARVKTLTKIAA